MQLHPKILDLSKLPQSLLLPVGATLSFSKPLFLVRLALAPPPSPATAPRDARCSLKRPYTGDFPLFYALFFGEIVHAFPAKAAIAAFAALVATEDSTKGFRSRLLCLRRFSFSRPSIYDL